MKIYIDQPHSLIHQGSRTNQEDSIYPLIGRATAEDRFFILCDGMGGHESGEVASSTVCERMSQWIKENIFDDRPITKDIVIAALDAAYDGLDEKDNPDALKKMGTTMTFIMFHRAGCTVAHIGDSRVYHISPLSQNIRHTQDHSLVNDLLKCGEITEDEVATSKIRNVITRAMQPHQERRSKPDVEIIEDIYPGDYFYMCSDGMLEKMSDEEIYRLIADQSISDDQKIEKLLSETKDNKDNHSAHLIKVLRVCNDDGTDVKLPQTVDVVGSVEIEEKDTDIYETTSSGIVFDSSNQKSYADLPPENLTKSRNVIQEDTEDQDEEQTIMPSRQSISSVDFWIKRLKVLFYGILILLSSYFIGKFFFFVRDHWEEFHNFWEMIWD